MPFRAPVNEFEFILENIIGYDRVCETEKFEHADFDTVRAVLTEAGKLCDDVLAPLNRDGDLTPSVLENGVVRTSPGFAEGFKAIAEGGWVSVGAGMDHGGMGLPTVVGNAVNDLMSGANISLHLAPLLSQGQIEAIEHHASDELKDLYLPKLISGEWTGTMNLTEPHAGSDVGALSSKAERNDDGTYNVSGQKIFITWGDHDVAENICHLVLARLPDGGKGTKGISLFLVPKYLPDENGKPGVANTLKCVSLEHKLGIHGSPTCVMQFDGAKGWLVGQEHAGMAAMFTMMNNARLGVGTQGVGVGEAAYQHALAYAFDRKQGASPHGDTIVAHADVRRMLLSMKADLFAARAISAACAAAIDLNAAGVGKEWKARAALLTPIAKAFGSDVGIAVANEGVQIHGGMGFVEETGAAQFARDVRITSIYEGTNGIQAMDLVARKMMDGGEAANDLIAEVEANAAAAEATYPELSKAVSQAAATLREATAWIAAEGSYDNRFAGAVPYLRGFARVLGGHYHLMAAMADQGGAREELARFYIERLLPEHVGALTTAQAGAEGLYNDKVMELLAS